MASICLAAMNRNSPHLNEMKNDRNKTQNDFE